MYSTTSMTRARFVSLDGSEDQQVLEVLGLAEGSVAKHSLLQQLDELAGQVGRNVGTHGHCHILGVLGLEQRVLHDLQGHEMRLMCFGTNEETTRKIFSGFVIPTTKIQTLHVTTKPDQVSTQDIKTRQTHLVNDSTAELVGGAEDSVPQGRVSLGHKIASKVLEQRGLVAYADEVVAVAAALIASKASRELRLSQ